MRSARASANEHKLNLSERKTSGKRNITAMGGEQRGKTGKCIGSALDGAISDCCANATSMLVKVEVGFATALLYRGLLDRNPSSATPALLPRRERWIQCPAVVKG
jgi:hypothetical protein